jgi:integrase
MTTAINFTKTSLASIPLPPPGKRTYRRDTKTRGLMVAVTDKGTRSFVFYRKIKGRPQRVLIGRCDEISVEQARNKAAALNAMVADGWDPRVERDHSRRELTLKELFSEFMSRHARANIRYSEKYEAQFKRYFCSKLHGGMDLADQKVSEVQKKDIARVFGSITAKAKPVTANRVLAMISSMFGWAVRAGLLESNPASGIRKNSERGRARDRFLMPSEMPHFFQALSAHESDLMRDYVLLSLLTGQRQANILAMEWSEIDFTSKIWRIPRHKTKTSREYVVPLTPDAAGVLERRRKVADPSPFVLPGSGGTGHFAEPKGGWRRLLMRAEAYALISAISSNAQWTAAEEAHAKAAMEFSMRRELEKLKAMAVALKIDAASVCFADLWMHDLRRTLASWQASTGANLVAISKTLNHSNVATTSIYARLQTDPVRQAIQVATSAMLTAAGVSAKAEVVRLRQAR